MSVSKSNKDNKLDTESAVDKCKVCEKIVRDKDKAVECEMCKTWVHCKCDSISDELYKIIKSKQRGFHWFCISCDEDMVNLITRMGKFEDKLLFIEKEQVEIKTSINQVKIIASNNKMEIENLNVAINTCNENISKCNENVEIAKAEMVCLLDQRIEKLSERMGKQEKEFQPLWSSLVKQEIESKFLEAKVEVTTMKQSIDESKIKLEEEKDKERRSNNIIIYNSEEKRSTDKEEWFRNEKSFCLKFFNDVLEVNASEEDIKKVVRLGKRTEDNKSRPMLIELRNKSLKNQIMESLTKIRNHNESYGHIIVCHDMTKSEREYCKELVEKAKIQELNEGMGEWIFRVRGNPGQLGIVKLRKRKQ